MDNRLYVGNLPLDLDDREFYDLLDRYGRVKLLSIRGKFAFVEYEQSDDATLALRKLDGRAHQGHSLIVTVAGMRKDDVKH